MSVGTPRRFGLVARLMVLHAIAMVVGLGAVGLLGQRRFAATLDRDAHDELGAEVIEFDRAANLRAVGQSYAEFAASWAETHAEPTGHFIVVGVTRPDGTLMVRATEESDTLQATSQVKAWMKNPPNRDIVSHLGSGHIRYKVLARPLVQQGSPVGSMVLAVDLAPIEKLSGQQWQITLMQAALAVIAASVSTFFLLRRLLRGVAHVTRTANEISSLDLSRRLNHSGPNDEMGQLAATFDGMLDRLSLAFAQQGELLAEVSHQLRTPLTVARGHLEVQARAGFADQLEVAHSVDVAITEIDHVKQLVERLLSLGEALERGGGDRLIALSPFLQEVVDHVRVMAEREWILVDRTNGVTFLADPDKVRGALLNLIDNAVKATKKSDTIEVSARFGDGLIIDVTDNGRGIREEDQARVFDRFARAGATSEHGTGLGLAIVKAVMESLGGRVSLRSKFEHGTTVTLEIPKGRVVTRPRERPTKANR